MEPTIRAAAYVRRSSATTESPGDASREAQLAAVRSLCGDDVEVYTDWGISGLKANRPDYQRLRSDIAAGLVGSVCAYSLSRLGRSTRELLDFVDLCKAKGVTIRTKVEAIDTSTAMGEFTFTLFAAIGQLEAQLSKERQASAREARKQRGDDFGAPYGYRLERQSDGSLRRVRDEAVDLEIVRKAYEDAGSILGACRLLEQRGVLAPKGRSRWHTSALTRVVEREWPEMRPRKSPGGRRRSVGHPLAQLVTCPFCGVRLTPNAIRGQLYCRNGAAYREQHPRYSVSARLVTAFLKTEAAKLERQIVEVRSANDTRAEQADRARARLERAQELYVAGDLPRDRYDQAKRDAEAEMERLAEESDAVQVPLEVDWSWPAPELNAVLRRLFREVTLDEGMRPVEAVWTVPEWRAERAA